MEKYNLETGEAVSYDKDGNIIDNTPKKVAGNVEATSRGKEKFLGLFNDEDERLEKESKKT